MRDASDDRLGRAVLVVDLRRPVQCRVDGGGQRGLEILAADHEAAQPRAVDAEAPQQREMRGRELDDVDGVGRDHVHQRGIDGTVGFGVDLQRAPGDQRQEHAGDREVEGERREQRVRETVAADVAALCPAQIVRQPAVVDRHALGPARRAGRVDEVREVLQARPGLDRSRPDTGVDRLGNRKHRDPVTRRHRGHALAHEEHACAGVLQHVVEARRWCRGVDRHIRGARPQRAEHGDDREHGPAAGDRHAIARGDAVRQQRRGEGVGLIPQRGERQRRRALPDGDHVGITGRSCLEHRGHRLLRQRQRGGGVQRGECSSLLVHEDVDRGDRPIGIVEHGIEQRLEVAQTAHPQPRLERVVIDVEVQHDAPGAGEVVDLEPQGMHAVAVSRVHPVDVGRQPREGAERARHVVEDDRAGGGSRRGAEARQRMAQQEQGLLQAPGRQRPERVGDLDGDREGEHLDEQAERAPGLRRRPTVDRGIEAEVAGAADAVEPADEQRREHGEPGHALRQMGPSQIAAEAVECARPGLAEVERQATAGRVDRDGRTTVEWHRPTGPLRPESPVLPGARARGDARWQNRDRRVVGGERRRRGAIAAQQALVLGPDLAVQQLRRPGVGDHVVLVEIPAGATVTERHEHAVDQIAVRRQGTGAACTAPLAERASRIGSGSQDDHLGGPPARGQRPPRVPALVVHDPRPQGVAGVDDPLPRRAEQIGAQRRREDEGERHVVQRALGGEPLADPDLLLAVRQRLRRGRGVARPVRRPGIAHGLVSPGPCAASARTT